MVPTCGTSSPLRGAVEEIGERLLHHVPPPEAVHQPEADHAAALAHQPAGLEGVLLAARDAVRHDPPERSERVGALVEHAAAGHLEHHVHGPALVRLDQRALEVLLGGVHRGVRAELDRLGALLLGARRGDHATGAERLRELHRQAPTPPAPEITTTDSPRATFALVL